MNPYTSKAALRTCMCMLVVCLLGPRNSKFEYFMKIKCPCTPERESEGLLYVTLQHRRDVPVRVYCN